MSISINVDELAVGIYNYTLSLLDSSGNIASDTVMVVVLADFSTITTTETTTEPGDYTMVILGVGGAGVGLVIVLMLLSRRRRS